MTYLLHAIESGFGHAAGRALFHLLPILLLAAALYGLVAAIRRRRSR